MFPLCSYFPKKDGRTNCSMVLPLVQLELVLNPVGSMLLFFAKWLEHFIDILKPTKERSIVLVLDGHYSHTWNIHVLDKAHEIGIQLFAFHHTRRKNAAVIVCFVHVSTKNLLRICNWKLACKSPVSYSEKASGSFSFCRGLQPCSNNAKCHQWL